LTLLGHRFSTARTRPPLSTTRTNSHAPSGRSSSGGVFADSGA
jgi:hypothetical protein